MQDGHDENADTQDIQDPLATLIIEKQRNNVTKGTQQIYDCYLKGFLNFCSAQGYTSENHSQILSIPKEQLQSIISSGIRPVACAQYINE